MSKCLQNWIGWVSVGVCVVFWGFVGFVCLFCEILFFLVVVLVVFFCWFFGCVLVCVFVGVF